MARAFIALGANLGERSANLPLALKLLSACKGIRIRAVSSFVETDPVGGPPGQPRYLNGAAEIETELDPRAVLELLLKTEHELGRDRSRAERNLPRVVDLDLLLYDGRIIHEEGLEVPHPRLHERAFVLEPLGEIAGDVIHPASGKSIRELRDELRGA